MKITLNELRSLVKQVLREAEEEKSKGKKGFDVSKLKKGLKLTIDMGKGEEKVEVMDNFKTGVTNTKFVTLKRTKGAPYTITVGKLKDVIVEGYEESEVDRYSSYNQDINERLKAYAEENGEDFSEMKSYFMNQANPYNMKTSKEAYDAYFKIVNKFLKDEKRNISAHNLQ